MNRRDMLAGMTAAAAGVESAEGASLPDPTLYIPSHHRVEDLALLHETMDEYPFAQLVSVAPALRITHIPVLVERGAGAYGTIVGHIARSNPQTAAIEGRAQATVVFQGPHAYISPSWYENTRAVPTWNFVTIHVSGQLEPVAGGPPLYELLKALVAKSENRYGPGKYTLDGIPGDYAEAMMKSIIGFRLRIETIEGKFKLGQERSAADREGILRNLPGAARDRGIVEVTRGFYESHPAKTATPPPPKA